MLLLFSVWRWVGCEQNEEDGRLARFLYSRVSRFCSPAGGTLPLQSLPPAGGTLPLQLLLSSPADR